MALAGSLFVTKQPKERRIVREKKAALDAIAWREISRLHRAHFICVKLMALMPFRFVSMCSQCWKVLHCCYVKTKRKERERKKSTWKTSEVYIRKWPTPLRHHDEWLMNGFSLFFLSWKSLRCVRFICYSFDVFFMPPPYFYIRSMNVSS